MVGDTLAAHQSEQANRISDEIVRQSLEHQQALQANAERRWKVAHQALVQIVRSLDPDYYDACQKSGRPIEQFEDEAILHWVEIRIKGLQSRITQTMRPDNSSTLQNSLDDALRKIQAAQQEEERLRESIRRLQEENQQLNAHLRAIQQVQRIATSSVVEEVKPKEDTQRAAASIETTNNEPDWLKEWRNGRTFQKESAALILMGETGKALRPSLIDLLAKKLNLSPTNSSLSETFNRLLNLDAAGGLIESLDVFTQPGATTGGNHPDIFRLSERGKAAYQVLAGKQPAENEYERLLRKHKSPEHTVLNIQAAEALVELAGYRIVDEAPDIHLPDGSVFIPDLVALDQKNGETVFIEVERDANKDRNARTRKWKNVLTATNGNIYVICDNISCERAVQAEINQALGNARFNSHLTNLNSIRKGKRAQDGGIWLSNRSMK
jgi:hypothetical protein